MRVRLTNLLLGMEKIFFPFLFLFFSLLHFLKVYAMTKAWLKHFTPVTLKHAMDFLIFTDVVYLIILAVFNIMIGYALLISRNLHQEPKGFGEVFIPLLATFWIYTYNIIAVIHPQGNVLVIPKEYLGLSVLIGMYIAVAGLVVALVAISDMRRSFSILVQVRDIITSGLYRYVRHPIYCGHIITMLGFALLDPRIYSILFVVIGIGLTFSRASLEEKKLCQFSEEYRRYKQNTPFIVPNFLNKG